MSALCNVICNVSKIEKSVLTLGSQVRLAYLSICGTQREAKKNKNDIKLDKLKLVIVNYALYSKS